MMSLKPPSALAGGDCIDDARVAHRGDGQHPGVGTVKAPSTLGTFLRSVWWGHERQLDPGDAAS